MNHREGKVQVCSAYFLHRPTYASTKSVGLTPLPRTRPVGSSVRGSLSRRTMKVSGKISGEDETWSSPETMKPETLFIIYRRHYMTVKTISQYLVTPRVEPREVEKSEERSCGDRDPFRRGWNTRRDTSSDSTFLEVRGDCRRSLLDPGRLLVYSLEPTLRKSGTVQNSTDVGVGCRVDIGVLCIIRSWWVGSVRV